MSSFLMAASASAVALAATEVADKSKKGRGVFEAFWQWLRSLLQPGGLLSKLKRALCSERRLIEASSLLPEVTPDLARDPAFGDFCLYNTVAQGQRHPVDRRVFRQRKNIAPLQPVCSRVDEMLFYHCSGHDTADGDIDLGCDQRRWRIIPRIDGTEPVSYTHLRAHET